MYSQSSVLIPSTPPAPSFISFAARRSQSLPGRSSNSGPLNQHSPSTSTPIINLKILSNRMTMAATVKPVQYATSSRAQKLAGLARAGVTIDGLSQGQGQSIMNKLVAAGSGQQHPHASDIGVVTKAAAGVSVRLSAAPMVPATPTAPAGGFRPATPVPVNNASPVSVPHTPIQQTRSQPVMHTPTLTPIQAAATITAFGSTILFSTSSGSAGQTQVQTPLQVSIGDNDGADASDLLTPLASANHNGAELVLPAAPHKSVHRMDVFPRAAESRARKRVKFSISQPPSPAPMSTPRASLRSLLSSLATQPTFPAVTHAAVSNHAVSTTASNNGTLDMVLEEVRVIEQTPPSPPPSSAPSPSTTHISSLASAFTTAMLASFPSTVSTTSNNARTGAAGPSYRRTARSQNSNSQRRVMSPNVTPVGERADGAVIAATVAETRADARVISTLSSESCTSPDSTAPSSSMSPECSALFAAPTVMIVTDTDIGDIDFGPLDQQIETAEAQEAATAVTTAETTVMTTAETTAETTAAAETTAETTAEATAETTAEAAPVTTVTPVASTQSELAVTLDVPTTTTTDITTTAAAAATVADSSVTTIDITATSSDSVEFHTPPRPLAPAAMPSSDSIGNSASFSPPTLSSFLLANSSGGRSSESSCPPSVSCAKPSFSFAAPAARLPMHHRDSAAARRKLYHPLPLTTATTPTPSSFARLSMASNGTIATGSRIRHRGYRPVVSTASAPATGGTIAINKRSSSSVGSKLLSAAAAAIGPVISALPPPSILSQSSFSFLLPAPAPVSAAEPSLSAFASVESDISVSALIPEQQTQRQPQSTSPAVTDGSSNSQSSLSPRLLRPSWTPQQQQQQQQHAISWPSQFSSVLNGLSGGPKARSRSMLMQQRSLASLSLLQQQPRAVKV